VEFACFPIINLDVIGALVGKIIICVNPSNPCNY